ncbi:MAG: hypothetical protein DRI74_06970 [Bacteroidetes bacterium]|nr:MAG: hypothetical protein DRI74_06970 [Bacteroidota bacterium]
MAIKRVTIEIDDTEDVKNRTEVPEELKTARDFSSDDKIGTGEAHSSEKNLNDEQIPVPQAALSTPNVGRTPYDLFFEIKEDNRSMVIFFVIISLIIFACKIGTITFRDYCTYVICSSILLNAFWFLIPSCKKRNK